MHPLISLSAKKQWNCGLSCFKNITWRMRSGDEDRLEHNYRGWNSARFFYALPSWRQPTSRWTWKMSTSNSECHLPHSKTPRSQLGEILTHKRPSKGKTKCKTEWKMEKKKKTHNTDHFCIIAESAIFFPQLWSEMLTFSLQIWLKSLVNSQTGCEFITQYWEHLGFFILLKWSFFFFPTTDAPWSKVCTL